MIEYANYTDYQLTGDHDELFKPLVDIVTITPTEAARMLQRNDRNRPIKQHNIAKFARSMLAGKWKLQPNGIGIDKNGNIVDGQHRLMAIVKAGVPAMFILVTGLEPETFDVIDTGAKRSGADTLATEGHDNAVLVAAVSYLLQNYLKQGSVGMGVMYGGGRIENYELREFAAQYPRLDGIATDAKTLYKMSEPKRLLEPRAIALTLAIYGSRYPQVKDWLEQVMTGTGLEASSPLMLFRNRLIADLVRGSKSHSNMHAANRAALLFESLNNVIKGKKRKSLKVLGNEEFPQPFGITPEMVANYLRS